MAANKRRIKGLSKLDPSITYVDFQKKRSIKIEKISSKDVNTTDKRLDQMLVCSTCGFVNWYIGTDRDTKKLTYICTTCYPNLIK